MGAQLHAVCRLQSRLTAALGRSQPLSGGGCAGQYNGGMKRSSWGATGIAIALALTGCGAEGDGNDSTDPDDSADLNDSAADDSAADEPPTTSAARLGEAHEGQYHLGPVDFAESEWHNACAPEGGYQSSLRPSVGLGGEFLAGVSNQFSQSGGVCDACILIETETGHSIVARVVTYGVEQEPGDIDVSPAVYEAINEDEYPRSMSWSFADCPDAGNILFEFHSGAHQWWTSLWVRNPRVPIEQVDVKKSGSDSYVTLERSSDGTLVDASGFGEDAFSLRVTAIDGQVVEGELPGFEPGSVVDSGLQFE